MRSKMLLTVLVASCTNGDPSPNGTDARVTGDGGQTPEVTTTTCKVNKAVTTAADNSRSELWSYYADIPNAQPGDNITAILCDPVTMPASTCAAGSTCTVQGDPFPSGRECVVGREIVFRGDHATVICGYDVVGVSTNGTTTSHTGTHYTSVEIRR